MATHAPSPYNSCRTRVQSEPLDWQYWRALGLASSTDLWPNSQPQTTDPSAVYPIASAPSAQAGDEKPTQTANAIKKNRTVTSSVKLRPLSPSIEDRRHERQ